MKRNILILLSVMTLLMSCNKNENQPSNLPQEITPAPYGYFYMADEEIPVVSFTTASETQFVLKISPMEEILSATTYAAIGVRNEFMGVEIDVQTKFHDDDYLFVYEDPTRYYAPFRQLQSGTIFIDQLSSGAIDVKIDVVLYDGTPFRYENHSLQTIIND